MLGRKISDILIVSDLDNTLLNYDLEISQQNIEAIKKFRRLGGKFTIATGRSIQAVEIYTQQLKLDLPAILSNGALIYDFNKKELLWSCKMENTAREQLELIMKQFPYVGVEVLIGGEIYVPSLLELNKNHLEKMGIDYKVCDLKDIPDGFNKILFVVEHEKIKKIKDFAKKSNFTSVNFVESCYNYLEMLPHNISKGQTLLKFVKSIGFDINNVVACGDYYNDYEMINLAGLGVAVKNANTDVKKIANFITSDCNDNAIANTIEYVIENFQKF